MNENPDQQPSSSCIDSPRNLLDLPLAWLVRFLKRLDRTSRLALKDLVLDSADSTRLTLQPLDMKQEQMLRALQLIIQHAKQVAVCFQRERFFLLGRKFRALHGSELATRSCSLLTQAQLLGYLDRVTSLKFAGARFAMPLMPVFSESCPNLTALSLCDSIITWQGVAADSLGAVFPKLQQLKLHNTESAHAPQLRLQACKHMQQQLLQLTGLKSLQLLHDGTFGYTDRVLLYMDITAALSTLDQLTFLEVPWQAVPDRFEWNQLKKLQSLQLHSCKLGDELMQQLLLLSNLKRLAVGQLAIEQSYRGHECNWQQLIINVIDLEHLARLPLHSKLYIKSGSCGFIILMLHGGITSAQIQEALENIIVSKWGGWHGAHVQLRYSKGPDQCALFAKALGLCHGAGHLTLDVTTIKSTGMAALEAYVASSLQGFVLDLSSLHANTDSVGLISHMPAGSSLVLSRIDEATVTRACSAAQRSFALQVVFMSS